VTCRMEVRNAAGGILMTLPLRPKVHRHASRDIAVLHSPDDAFMIDELDQVRTHSFMIDELDQVRTHSWLDHSEKRNFHVVTDSAVRVCQHRSKALSPPPKISTETENP
jgi:hypothetical protein